MENLCKSHTMKLFLPLLHEITESVEGSSTKSKVFVKNGGALSSCRPSTGCGEKDEDAAPHAAAMLVAEAAGVSSSSAFTST